MYQGTLAIFLLALVAVHADVPCMDPLEVINHGKIVLRSKDCSQRVNQTDLQTRPEVIYHANLEPDHKYALIFFENKIDAPSKRLHWFLTDIIPRNHSLTANSKTLVHYQPPTNDKATNYTFQLYKYHFNDNFTFHMPSSFEMEDFIPERWAQPFGPNLIIYHSRSFLVYGDNHTHPATTFRPETTTPSATISTTTEPHHHQGSTTPLPSAASNSAFGLAVLIIPIASLAVKSTLF